MLTVRSAREIPRIGHVQSANYKYEIVFVCVLGGRGGRGGVQRGGRRGGVQGGEGGGEGSKEGRYV